jgi:hypothetical protein
MREVYSYANTRGINATPTSAINGVILTDAPGSPGEWMDSLK